MRLTFIALVFLLFTIAGNHPSAAWRMRPIIRFPVPRPAPRPVPRPIPRPVPPPVPRPVVQPRPQHNNPTPSKLPVSSNPKSRPRNDVVARTPMPKSNNGNDGQIQQRKDVTVHTPAPKSSPPTGKPSKTNNSNNRKTQQRRKDAKDPTSESYGNPNIDNDQQTDQQDYATPKPATSTLKTPRTEKSGNSTSVKVRETPLQETTSSRTEVHHHHRHHHSSPQQISYGSTSYPVYQGHTPSYVNEYRDSGSRYDNLLTGLALYNLGRNSHSHHNSDKQYSGTPGEICKLGISKRNGEYEETRIDCKLISSFILEDMKSTAQNTTPVNPVIVTNGTGNSSTATVTSKAVQNALEVKGPSIAVSPDMRCFMIRTLKGATTLRKDLDCALLQEYARNSPVRNSAHWVMSYKAITCHFFIIFVGLGTL